MKKILSLIVLVLFIMGCKKRVLPEVYSYNYDNKAFSVGDGVRVYFSQGNLQYNAYTDTWRFAENQYDYIGDANSNISASYDGWVDLFSWGTGNNPTSTHYQSYHDWGDNVIINGDGKQWRTLTNNEWSYVINERKTISGIRYVTANVNSINGVILLPDRWNVDLYDFKDHNGGGSYYSNVVSKSDWLSKLEANGAVFLPAAGLRLNNANGGVSIGDVGSGGYIWSRSSEGFVAGVWDAYCVFVLGSDLRIGYIAGDTGLSVRLVCPSN